MIGQKQKKILNNNLKVVAVAYERFQICYLTCKLLVVWKTGH